MKKVLISSLILILVVSMFTTVNAATGNITVSADPNSVSKGQTFTVTVAGTADNNITGMQATLTYDTSKVEISNKAAGANFTDASGSNSEIAILSIGSTLEKSATLYTITFKVLDTAATGETTIAVKNGTLALVDDNSSQTNLVVADADVTVNIVADTTGDQNNAGNENVPGENNNNTNNAGNVPGENNNTNNAGNVSNENNNNSNNAGTGNTNNSNTNKNTVTSNGNKNTNKNSSNLPQTGIENTGVIAIVVLGIISIVSYISYNKYRNI